MASESYRLATKKTKTTNGDREIRKVLVEMLRFRVRVSRSGLRELGIWGEIRNEMGYKR